MNKLVNKENYLPRIIDKTIEKYLTLFGCLCITGPKWCGKSWTSSYHSSSELLLEDPSQNFNNLNLAKLNPSLVLVGDTPRLIDEWQDASNLWDAIRYEVDRRGKKGQFILTGSTTPFIENFKHSGAGRICRLNMSTMSLYETKDSSGTISLKDLCNENFTDQLTGEVDILNLIKYILRGGWPENINVNINDASILPKSYIEALLDVDIEKIYGKNYNKTKLKHFLMSLARNESTTASINKLVNDINETNNYEVERKTATQYYNLLNNLYLIDDQMPFSNNIRSSIRIKQNPKRHFVDVSLACALLNLNASKLLNNLQLLGFLFESLVEHDLKIYARANDYSLYHYQNYNDKEIDAIIELDNENYCAFEIKLGTNQIDQACKNLLNFKESIKKENGIPPKILCVICGLTNAAYKRTDGIYVVPITALKD